MEKQYESLKNEQSIQGFWENESVYKVKADSSSLYSIDTPPPTVSGSLHIGHIFSYTQTDIIARYKRMVGFNVFYPFGFDDNGLPTERYVEKKRGIKGHLLPRSEFIAICAEESKQAAVIFTQLWKRMGISADWSHTYSTISSSTQRLSQKLFIELFNKKKVYRSQEIALYCTACQTSVSQAEIDDLESKTFFNTIIFAADNGNDLAVATTRPELLAACAALFYHPDDDRYRLLKGTYARVPVYGHLVPLMPDERVLIDKGTGLVMCCTFGDKTDIEWFKQYNLPYKQVFDKRGRWLDHTGELAGMNVHDARKKIIHMLQEQGALSSQKPLTNMVNVHERCGTPIEYIMLPQWFISIKNDKQQFLEAGNKIEWFPAYMQHRYTNWVENIGWDWCISRQRFYGIPFPVWHCADCAHIIVASEDQLPLDPQVVGYNQPCPQCKGTRIVADADVMDTWNTSSISPYVCQELYRDIIHNNDVSIVPMSMRPQAHDIIRTWAFDTIVKAQYHSETIPWQHIVISGHVLSGSSEKISKSKENSAMSPAGLLERYSADAIRYWTASGSLGTDIAFSENQIKIGNRLVTKLWNAFRFIKEQLGNDFGQYSNTPTSYGPINEWLFDALAHTMSNYHKGFDSHEFSSALQAIEQFFWSYFCDQYLELIKHQLFHPELYSQEQIYQTRYTLYHVGYAIIQLYAPFVPHITDVLYQEFYKQVNAVVSIHQTTFVIHSDRYLMSVQSVDYLMKLIAVVRKIKTEKQQSLKVPMATLTIICAQKNIMTALVPFETLIKGVTQSDQIVWGDGMNNQVCALEQRDELWYGTVIIDQLPTHGDTV